MYTIVIRRYKFDRKTLIKPQKLFKPRKYRVNTTHQRNAKGLRHRGKQLKRSNSLKSALQEPNIRSILHLFSFKSMKSMSSFSIGLLGGSEGTKDAALLWFHMWTTSLSFSITWLGKFLLKMLCTNINQENPRKEGKMMILWTGVWWGE